MKKFSALFFAVMAVSILIPSYGQNVVNCPSGFASSGACGVSLIGSPPQAFALVGSNGTTTPNLSGSSVELIEVPPGGHLAISLMYQTPVNVQAFTATYTFIGDGKNVVFVLTNTNN